MWRDWMSFSSGGDKLKVMVDYFAGFGGASQAFLNRENRSTMNCPNSWKVRRFDIYDSGIENLTQIDLLESPLVGLPYKPELAWFSPPCDGFSQGFNALGPRTIRAGLPYEPDMTLANRVKEIIEHKNFIGGRYSVLSEVGMLPAELMGLNEKKFKQFNVLIKNKPFLNQLIQNVGSTLDLVKKDKYVSVILNYDEKSDNLFKWYQQLIAESLGKKSKGILPLISSMPKDNHSLMQFYLDGPKKNFYTFFSVYEKNSNFMGIMSLFI